MLSAILAACATYALFLCVHWIPFRTCQVKRRTRLMTLILILCLPSVVPFYFLFSRAIPPSIDFGRTAGAIFYAVIFILLWCGYVQFVFSFDTSPSLKVLVKLLDGDLTEAEIKRQMNFPDTFKRRFFRAVEGGAIVEDPERSGRYCVHTRGILVARVGRAAKALFQLGAGG